MPTQTRRYRSTGFDDNSISQMVPGVTSVTKAKCYSFADINLERDTSDELTVAGEDADEYMANHDWIFVEADPASPLPDLVIGGGGKLWAIDIDAAGVISTTEYTGA